MVQYKVGPKLVEHVNLERIVKWDALGLCAI